MLELHDQIEESAGLIRSHWSEQPDVGIILGTGLGGLVEQIDVEAAIDYDEVSTGRKTSRTFCSH